MTRPQSILWFERLFLASLGISLLATLLGWSDVEAQLAADPNTAAIGTPLLLISVTISIGVSLLFWFLIARRGSNAARWILLALYVVGAVIFGFTLAGQGFTPNAPSFLNLLSWALSIAALQLIFRRDAALWFADRDGPGEPADLP